MDIDTPTDNKLVDINSINLYTKILYFNSNKISIYLETNNVKLITTIEGPNYVTGFDAANEIKINININLPTYSKNDKNNNNKIDKNLIEMLILKIIKNNIFTENHKKSEINIKFDILEYNCNFTHYCILISSYALMHLGIEQKGILTSSNIVINNEGKFTIDPNFEEENNSKIKIQLACLVDTQEVTSFIQKGSIIQDNNNKIFNQAVALSIQVCKEYKNYIHKLI